MAEIPGLMWSVVGILISVFSLFLGFLRKDVEYSTFFRLMMFVGIAMFSYGAVKLYIRRKTAEKNLQAKKHELIQKRERSADIDIDDYRRNPKLRQQAMQQSGQSHQTQQPQHRTHQQQQHKIHHTPQQSHTQQHSQHKPAKQKSSFCGQCGTPLLKQHKFCPICGART